MEKPKIVIKNKITNTDFGLTIFWRRVKPIYHLPFRVRSPLSAPTKRARVRWVDWAPIWPTTIQQLCFFFSDFINYRKSSIKPPGGLFKNYSFKGGGLSREGGLIERGGLNRAFTVCRIMLICLTRQRYA